MSADNWIFCPVCEKENDKINAERIEKAEKNYGVIPANQYIQSMEKANKPIEIEETLREDYDIYIEDGVFKVNYSCRCGICGLDYSFEHKESIVEQEQEDE